MTNIWLDKIDSSWNWEGLSQNDIIAKLESKLFSTLNVSLWLSFVKGVLQPEKYVRKWKLFWVFVYAWNYYLYDIKKEKITQPNISLINNESFIVLSKLENKSKKLKLPNRQLEVVDINNWNHYKEKNARFIRPQGNSFVYIDKHWSEQLFDFKLVA